MADNKDQAAAAPPAAGNPAPAPEPVAGATRIRCAYPGDSLIVGKQTVTGVDQEFSATASKEIQAAALANDVQLVVTENKK